MKAQLQSKGQVIAEIEVSASETPDVVRWHGRWFKSVGYGFGTIYVYEETTGIDLG